MNDDTVLEAIGKGSIKATMQVGGKLSQVTITQVLHVPKMKNNLISMSKLIFEGFKVEFDKMVVRSTMLKELLWWKHEGIRNSTFLMWRCTRTRHTLQILRMKVRCFGMKDLAISTWQALRSWMLWWMAWIWKKCCCITFMKDASKVNIKKHISQRRNN